jgi:tetratricopeptide (TPR) repeat protein
MSTQPPNLSGRPDLARAAQALAAGNLALAEAVCRDVLKRDPRNTEALQLLGDVGIRHGRLDDAELLLSYCLELAPDLHPARRSYADLLFRKLRLCDALAEIDKVLSAAPDDAPALLLRASMLTQAGSLDEAVRTYDTVLRKYPEQPRPHLGRAHALKTLGRHAEALADYQRALALQPELGEAYWDLANLKTFRFDDAHVARMRALLAKPTTPEDDRVCVSFALGKALEDRGDYDESFRHYAAGNALRRRAVRWDPDAHQRAIERIKGFFQPAFFAAHATSGHPSSAPIFIVGMPRAGSTLLEQILASHSAVEGTLELPDVMVRVQQVNSTPPGFPEVLGTMTERDFAAFADEYLERTAEHREGAPHFIDKMPNNYGYVGLIHLMLPNATIIDARREPMACGFSVFKQLFANGQHFSYDLADIGRYYRDYVGLMAHWDTVLPGRVLRVDYESIVTDTVTEVRRVLAHCGLEFEPACLEFFNTKRAIRTPSSEQVRRPVYRDGLEQWRHYEAHLGPLLEIGSEYIS